MNKQKILVFQKEIGTFINFFKSDFSFVKENSEVCSITLSLYDYQKIERIVETFSPYHDFISLTVYGSVERFSFSYSFLDASHCKCTDWQSNESITTEISSDKKQQILDQLESSFSSFNTQYQTNSFLNIINSLLSEFKNLSISVALSVNKLLVLNELFEDKKSDYVLYLFEKKLISELNGKNFLQIPELINGNGLSKLFLMVGDITGVAIADGCSIIGLDKWADENLFTPLSPENISLIKEVISFKRNVSYWEFDSKYLIPSKYNFYSSTILNSTLLAYFRQLTIHLCIAYLSNKVYVRDGNVVCEFTSSKNIKILLPALDKPIDKDKSTVVYNLFSWGYENFSSDKLSIISEIISKELSSDQIKNFELLIDKASDITEFSKHNFQLLLQKDVKDFFEYRESAFSSLKSLSETTNENITKITSDLSADLFKTIGVILSVLVATLVEKDRSIIVIHWSLVLYFVYICIIFVTSNVINYFKFSSNCKLRLINIDFAKFFLTQSEIKQSNNVSGVKYRIVFLVIFFFSNAVYAILGTIAYLGIICFK